MYHYFLLLGDLACCQVLKAFRCDSVFDYCHNDYDDNDVFIIYLHALWTNMWWVMIRTSVLLIGSNPSAFLIQILFCMFCLSILVFLLVKLTKGRVPSVMYSPHWRGWEIAGRVVLANIRFVTAWIVKYCQTSYIRCTKSQNLNVYRLVLQLSLPNSLKSGVK